MSLNPYLEKALANNCLSPVLLLVGSDTKGVALELSAKILGCAVERLEANNHPDFHLLSPEGKGALHSIEGIRAAIEKSHESAYLGGATVFLIEAASQMQPAAANALLKTLEEPSKESTWILLAEREQDLLPTIVSRCTALSVKGESAAVILGEEKEILQRLLKERPSYPKLGLELEKIEKLIEGEQSQKKALSLLTLVAEHYYALAKTNFDQSFSWEEPLTNVYLAFERNIKLSTCLEYLFVKC